MKMVLWTLVSRKDGYNEIWLNSANGSFSKVNFEQTAGDTQSVDWGY